MSISQSAKIEWVVRALDLGAWQRRMFANSAADIVRAAELTAASIAQGGKLLLFGNGGSAADAQHIAAELVGRFSVDRAPLAAIALTVDTSALTAIGNDYGYDFVFERQVRALGRKGDVAIAISTSGKSQSIVKAVAAAKELGMTVIALTGTAGQAFADSCDVGIVAPTRETARIQELHITVGHLLCALIEVDVCALPLQSATPLLDPAAPKYLTEAALQPLRDAYRADGRTVVWTNGCFDVLHAGHISSLRAAKALGDVLVVGINTDETVRAAKGDGRPVNSLAARAAMLSALEMVDHVVAFGEATPSEILGRLQPDVHCKGADYAPPHGAPIPEAEIVRAYGGRIEFLPLVEGYSTTAVLKRLAS